ncbi:MAG: farnesyl-diphosphate farnesyltransferase [Candidatus Entotheonella factor]|uniref:Farnesyl-diphosphate farnesyltransferase n=1 Tax=Entotheonella factor TaxID=1429438 RepID=W4LRV5_ENTF1|nr:MAG: farnesyl-diphosphate farnesyltransferase [Candidatus Entotheonella factor]
MLKRVSRSFYLSLIVLPKEVREQIGLAYLFCRAADTIADTHILPPTERQQALNVFRHQFQLPNFKVEELERLSQQLLPHQATVGEGALLQSLPACFDLYTTFSDADQKLIQTLVLTLTKGMDMDLAHFPIRGAPQAVRALPTPDDLDRYTYYVAGVVGAFWTRMHAAHLPALQGCDIEELCQQGIRFGQGLQMTNILKDIAHDFQLGHCYLPATELTALRVDVRALQGPETLSRIRPLLDDLVLLTLEHLDQARDYICALPKGVIRLRLSCMWPLLFAVQTLAAICQSPDLLSPNVRVKISRGDVYQTMLRSLRYLCSQRAFVAYYTHLRQGVVQCLSSKRCHHL